MNDRFSRQVDIVPIDRILDCKATVIGVGRTWLLQFLLQYDDSG